MIILCLSILCLPLFAFSATYEVGPGKGYANIGDVPWENMEAGDQVLIYWRQEPYTEKWVIAVQGTEQQPFKVQGVASDSGQLPVIDGRNATTRSQINFWNEGRGVIKIGGANIPAVAEPTWIILENLDIRSGRTPYKFTGRDGLTSYAENAASVYMETGQNITIRNCILHDSGNGLFISHAARNILIEGCRIYDNGIEHSIYQHNTYTAAIGIIYQFNYLGPLQADCLGNNLKDRSAGLVVRYNWIESGNRQLDLVDAEDSMALVNHPSYRKTYVYGNILIEPDGAGNSQIIHYGGDSGNESIYRKGTLYFYNNTVVSSRSGNITLLRLSTNDESCDCRNNILYTTAAGRHLALVNEAGVVRLKNNWLKAGWVDSHSGLSGTMHDDGGNITGDTPGFVDGASQDYHLASNSACIDAGTTLNDDAYPVLFQYVKQQSAEARPSDSTLDIGAYEFKKNRSLRGQPVAVWLLLHD
ncbi:MAG: right-handed parallel beta-helix repeat-containing protein [Deltaproteobacteria bacterium]|nr:right-handed parallel beta-helix repeat-containing protein [Deltaproteobacteria bacterium]